MGALNLPRSLRVGWAAFLLAFWSAVQPARANDSTAYLGAGGLEFTTTDSVAMEREDLFVSRERIRVEYVFRNVTTSPVDLRVAFPLPRLDMRVVFGCSDVSIPFRDRADVVGFETRVDGRSVALERQEKAYLGDREVTPLLRDLNLPFASTGDDLTAALKRLQPDERERLKLAGALVEDACGGGSDGPAWTAEVIYHRQQRFAPSAVTRVQHSYTPSVGSFFVAPTAKLVGPQDRRAPDYDPSLARYCMDEGTWRAIRSMSQGREVVVGQPLEYILQTARSWRGAIGEFVLTIDKGSPDDLVSLCASGVRKTGPTSFEMRRRDYRPDRDLAVLFVSRRGR